jgi:hypothetical protein
VQLNLTGVFPVYGWQPSPIVPTYVGCGLVGNCVIQAKLTVSGVINTVSVYGDYVDPVSKVFGIAPQVAPGYLPGQFLCTSSGSGLPVNCTGGNLGAQSAQLNLSATFSWIAEIALGFENPTYYPRYVSCDLAGYCCVDAMISGTIDTGPYRGLTTTLEQQQCGNSINSSTGGF